MIATKAPGRGRQSGSGEVIAFFAGVVVLTLAMIGIYDPLVSMSLYTGALMSLNQIAPPLLLLAIGPSARSKLRSTWLGRLLLDPWVAMLSFVAFTVVIGFPEIFDRSLANVVFSAPLGALELLTGVMLWYQLFPVHSADGSYWKAGLAGWVAGLPMMVLGVVWIWSSHVLYSPYLNVICNWNITPLQDQRWAGVIMVIFGLPLQLRSTWLISAIFLDRTVV